MKRKQMRLTAILALLALYLLHNDLWWWHSRELIFGLPIGLVYHVFYCFTAALLFFLLVKFAWPRHLEVEPEDPAAGS